jgi:hypothetical protein
MHLSLKGSMDRQPLTDRLGDRLLAEYGGAAAAYSLRALNGNGDSVVRVRRASDNDEEDFTAEQIELGEMVNWVNSQTVPPLDIGVETSEGRIPVPEGGTSIGIPAAAYSLRNLSTTYTGNVVDVRRSSGGTESFTAAEVADGTLTDWVLAPVSSLIGNRMFFDGVDDYVSFSDATNIRPESSNFSVSITVTLPANDAQPLISKGNAGSADIGYSIIIAAGNLISVRCNADGTVAQRASQSYDASALPAGNYTIKLEIDRDNAVIKGYLDGSNVGWINGGGGPSSNDITGFGSINNTDDLYVGKTSLAFFAGILNELSVSKNSTDILYALGNGNTDAAWVDQIGSNDGTVNGSPELFTGQGYDGFVSKWYDQSGNDNHATQGTDASQPKIVNGGSLVTNNGNAVVNFQSIDDRHFIFGAGIDLTARTVFYAGRPASTNFQNLLGNTSNSSTNYIRTLNNVAGRPWETEPSSSIFVDGSAYAGGDVSDQGYSLNTFVFDSDATVNFLGGTGAAISDTPIVDASEIIIYPSDQSANRTAIEANIGETYGITGIPAYDNTVDGFVETWYDQSGNGNDATQSVATKQPKIVDGGSLVTGGLDFDGVDDFLNFSAGRPITSIDAVSGFFVGRSNTSSNQCGVNLSSPTGSRRFYLPVFHSGQFRFGYAGDISAVNLASSNTSEHIFTGIAGTSTASGYYDGEIKGTVTSATGVSGVSGIGSISNSYNWDGEMREIIIYDSDQSANRVGIETNINDHYNIY